jgi:hypothetical protein
VAYHGTATEDNSIEINNMAVSASLLGAEVSNNQIQTSGGETITTGDNWIDDSFGASAGITQVGQQSGINSLQQQNVNVQSSLTLSR